MEQLAQLDARAAFPDWPEPCRIPTLAQVLAQLPTDVRLEIEIKGDETTRLETLAPKLVELIERHDAAGRVTLSSFDANALRILQRVAPGLPRAYIGAYDSPQFLRTALAVGVRAGRHSAHDRIARPGTCGARRGPARNRLAR
jgi:glycerophosphoryl diester phosphodiesterase